MPGRARRQVEGLLLPPTFKPCELLDLIGPGEHDFRTIRDSSSIFFDITTTFFLDPGTC